MRGGTGRVVRRRAARVTGVARPLLGLLAAVVLGGCQYLFGFDPNIPPPDFSRPEPVAVYREGRATVTVGSDPAIVLEDLSDTGTFDPSFGAGATFRNADGWFVRVMGASKLGGFLTSTAYVQLDRIVGLEHWTTADPSRCVVTIFAADATGLMGKATCKGLRWSDALGSYSATYEPPYIKDQPAFDAEITFEATSSGKQVG
jgi:hypothetical protein